MYWISECNEISLILALIYNESLARSDVPDEWLQANVSQVIGVKTLLQQGISEPIFYGDLVYKLKQIVGKPNFSDQFKKILKRYIRVGYMPSFKPNHGL